MSPVGRRKLATNLSYNLLNMHFKIKLLGINRRDEQNQQLFYLYQLLYISKLLYVTVILYFLYSFPFSSRRRIVFQTAISGKYMQTISVKPIRCQSQFILLGGLNCNWVKSTGKKLSFISIRNDIRVGRQEQQIIKSNKGLRTEP